MLIKRSYSGAIIAIALNERGAYWRSVD